MSMTKQENINSFSELKSEKSGETSSSNNSFRSGFVALIGRPNSGKSTLLNALIGDKVAITSGMAQTTRHRIRAVLNTEDMQAIFIDTPGIHKPHDVLGEELNESAYMALKDVDALAYLFDCSQSIGAGDRWIIDETSKIKSPKICVLSKIDLVDNATKMQQIENLMALQQWDSIVAISSVENNNLDAFVEEVYHFLPEGPAWFPQDMITDQQLEVLIAEYIREKIIYNVSEEVPHSVGVEVEDLQYIKKKNLWKIYASVFVERESQRGIIIGKDGAKIKKIGAQSRKDLQRLLEKRVFLDLNVKVRKNWRRDLNQIKRFGYNS